MKIMKMINHPTGGVLATVAKLHCRCFRLLPGVHIFQIYNHSPPPYLIIIFNSSSGQLHNLWTTPFGDFNARTIPLKKVFSDVVKNKKYLPCTPGVRVELWLFFSKKNKYMQLLYLAGVTLKWFMIIYLFLLLLQSWKKTNAKTIADFL